MVLKAINSTKVFIEEFNSYRVFIKEFSYRVGVKEITLEAVRIIFSLGLLDKPNTPDGSHYMTNISDEFLANASTNDMDTLLSLVSKSVKGVYFSTLNTKGCYALVKDNFWLKKLLNNKTELFLIHQHMDYAFLVGIGVQADPVPFKVVRKLNITASSHVTSCEWCEGYYMANFSSAAHLYLSKILQS